MQKRHVMPNRLSRSEAADVGLVARLQTFVQSDWGLLGGVVVLYSNIPAVIHPLFRASLPVKGFILLGTLAFLVCRMRDGAWPLGWERVGLFTVGYGLVGLASLFYAGDLTRTCDALMRYVQYAIMVLVVTVLLQRFSTLRRVVWALLAAGTIMGTLSVYQQFTGTFESDYWGFGQASIEHIVGATNGYRLSGPISDPNYYAQILVVLIPLALERLLSKRAGLLRLLAVWALAVCGLTIVFTYSRGGLLALLVVSIMFVAHHPPRPTHLVGILILSLPLLHFVPDQYVNRMKTLRYLVPGLSDKLLEEPAFRGRLSENIVAWQMFVEHPFRGIGLGNYETSYQSYSQRLGIDPRREDREAHNLYLEVASETGILGLTVFGCLLWSMFHGLRRARSALTKAGLADAAELILALRIGMIGFLIASLFLHAAYHHFWLLFGISMAVPQAVRRRLGSPSEACDKMGACER